MGKLNPFQAIVKLLAFCLLGGSAMASTGPSPFVGRKIEWVEFTRKLHLGRNQLETLQMLQTQTVLQLDRIRDNRDMNENLKRSQILKARLSFERSVEGLLTIGQCRELDRQGGTNALIGRRNPNWLLDLKFLSAQQRTALESILSTSASKIVSLRADRTLDPEVRRKEILLVMDRRASEANGVLTSMQRQTLVDPSIALGHPAIGSF